MKNIALSLLIASFSLASFATEEQAVTLYGRRGEDKKYAAEAAAEYKKLAAAEADVLKKATLKIAEAEATFFVGVRTPVKPKEARMEVFEAGYTAATEAFNLLAARPGVAKQDAWKNSLARAYYWYSANLGKWGETKGVLASLGRWPELKEKLFYILSLDKTAQEYGANRVLGAAYMKVPYESKKEALKFLTEAYNNTLVSVVGVQLSVNPTTVIYYLESLADQDKADTFCKVYSDFNELNEAALDDDSVLLEYSPKLVPETRDELKDFREAEKDAYKDIKKYFDKNC